MELLGWTGCFSRAGSGVGTKCFNAAALVGCAGPDTNEERDEFGRDVKVIKEEVARVVEAPGGGFCGVLGTWDVSQVYNLIMLFRYVKDASEDAVGGLVPAGTLPPSLDDPLGVSIGLDVLALA